MAYLDLHDPEARGHRQRRHEGVERPDGKEGLRHLPAEGLEGAARVADAVSQEPRPDAVGDARHQPPQGGVLSLRADSDDHVRLCQAGKEPRDVGRIVLAVPVECDEDLAARLPEAGEESAGLTLVARDLDHGPAATRRPPAQSLRGGVRAPIVDQHDLVRLAEAARTGRNSASSGDVLLLVVEGDDDGELRAHRTPS
jgi:hypothetical protein